MLNKLAVDLIVLCILGAGIVVALGLTGCTTYQSHVGPFHAEQPEGTMHVYVYDGDGQPIEVVQHCATGENPTCPK